MFNVEEKQIIKLVNNAWEKQSLSEIDVFLKKKKQDLSINHIFLLELEFISFDALVKKKTLLTEINLFFDEFLEEKKDELTDFNVFDVFESSEAVKSKSSTLTYFVLYQNFFREIFEKKKSCLNLYLLFENYIFFEKKRFAYLDISNKEQLFFFLTEFSEFSNEKKNLFSDNLRKDIEILKSKEPANLNNFSFQRTVFLVLSVIVIILLLPANAKAASYKSRMPSPQVTQAMATESSYSRPQKEAAKANQVNKPAEIKKEEEKKLEIKVGTETLKQGLVQKGFNKIRFFRDQEGILYCNNSIIPYYKKSLTESHDSK